MIPGLKFSKATKLVVYAFQSDKFCRFKCNFLAYNNAKKEPAQEKPAAGLVS